MPSSLRRVLRVAVTGTGPRGSETIFTTLLVGEDEEPAAIASRRASILGLAPPYTVRHAPVPASSSASVSPPARPRRARH